MSYHHNFTAPKTKRGIRTSDFGTNGFYINFKCAPIPPTGVPNYVMTPPTLTLKNLGLYLWADLKTGQNPSPGLVNEVRLLLQSYSEKLKEIDKASLLNEFKKPDAQVNNNVKEVFLPNIDVQAPKILDLATGELVDMSKIRSDEELFGYLDENNRSAVLYDDSADKGRLSFFRTEVSDFPAESRKGFDVVKFDFANLPIKLHVKTLEGKTYQMQVKHADNYQCHITYRDISSQRKKPVVQNKDNSEKPVIKVAARFITVPQDSNEIAEFFEEEKVAFLSDANYANILNDTQIEQLLKLIHTIPDTKVLASPTIKVRDGQDASALTQKEIVYLEPNSSRPVYLPIGIKVDVTPQLRAQGKHIFLETECEKTELLGYKKSLPEIQSTHITSQATVPDGQTLLLGHQNISVKEDSQIKSKDLLILIKAEKLEPAELQEPDELRSTKKSSNPFKKLAKAAANIFTDPGPLALLITGTVTDAQTAKPIAGVKVSDGQYGPKPDWNQIQVGTAANHGAITDKNGRYRYLTWHEHHTITAQAKGYKPQQKPLYNSHLTIPNKDKQTFNFTLNQN